MVARLIHKLVPHLSVQMQANFWCRESPTKIDAIRSLRGSARIGLKESKDLIDAEWPEEQKRRDDPGIARRLKAWLIQPRFSPLFLFILAIGVEFLDDGKVLLGVATIIIGSIICSRLENRK